MNETSTAARFHLDPVARLRRLAGSLELLRTLVLKDLRAHYKSSTFGFLWALANPLLMMVVYSLIFVVVAKVKVMNYPALLLSGLVPWSFFSSTLLAGTGAIIDNANLVKKLRLPREVLPASVVAANLIHFALALVLLFVFLPLLGVSPRASWLLVPFAAVPLLAFAAGLAFATSSLAPAFHDVRFLVSAGTSLWFFATPIVYPLELVPEGARAVMQINPMTGMVQIFQFLLVSAAAPDSGTVVWTLITALATLWFGLRVFDRFDGRLADLL